MNFKKIIAGTAVTAAFAFSSMGFADGNFTPDQVKAIQNIVHKYLVKNPKVLVEASRALQAQQMKTQQANAVSAIEKNKQQIFNDSASPVAGNPNGNVSVVEFFDYQCGHCKTMNTTINSLLKDNSNVRLVLKELPIFGGNSKFAAQAALAAKSQNKYFEFHKALLATSNPLDNNKVMAVAKKVGLNIDQLKKDMNSENVQQELRMNFKLAEKLKLMGTPAFIISNKALTKFRFIPGATSLANLKQQIKAVQNNS